jgi:hypothetical protein
MKLTPNWNIEQDHNKERGTSLIGRVVYVHCQEPLRDPSYVLSTAHIIGWDVTKNKDEDGYFTFTSLADGMTAHYSLEKLIEVLNAQPYLPIPGSALQKAMAWKIPLK